MIPPQQRLGCDRCAGAEINDGLEVQVELAPGNGGFELLLKLQPRVSSGVCGGIEHRITAASGGLSFVHGGVGMRKQRLGIRRFRRGKRHANADAWVHDVRVEDAGRRGPFDDAAGDDLGFGIGRQVIERITNSSPPMRATASLGRRLALSRSTIWRRSASPAACPSQSLICFRRSTSMNKTASG